MIDLVSPSAIRAVLKISRDKTNVMIRECGMLRVGPRIIRVPAAKLYVYLTAHGCDPESATEIVAAMVAHKRNRKSPKAGKGAFRKRSAADHGDGVSL